ncbi:hypothetical protein MAR_001620, partial [Mya arenaria]
MASKQSKSFKDSVLHASDEIHDFSCSVCKDDNLNTEAKMCRSISMISDLARDIHKMTDFKQLPAKVAKVLASLNQVGEARKKNQSSLKASGKSILTKIKNLRKTLNKLLDEIEKKTVEAMDSVLVDLDGSIQKDIDQSVHLHDQLEALMDTIQTRGDDSESSSYIGYRRCQDKIAEVNSLLKQMSTRPEATITFQPDTQSEQLLSELKTLGYIEGYPDTQFQNNPVGVPSPGGIITFS